MSSSEDGSPDPSQSSLVVSEGEQHHQCQDQDIGKLQRVAERSVSSLAHTSDIRAASTGDAFGGTFADSFTLRYLRGQLIESPFPLDQEHFFLFVLGFLITLGKDVHDS